MIRIRILRILKRGWLTELLTTHDDVTSHHNGVHEGNNRWLVQQLPRPDPLVGHAASQLSFGSDRYE